MWKRYLRIACNYHPIPRAPTVEQMQKDPLRIHQEYAQRSRDAKRGDWLSVGTILVCMGLGVYSNKDKSGQAQFGGLMIGTLIGLTIQFMPLVTIPGVVYLAHSRHGTEEDEKLSFCNLFSIKETRSEDGKTISLKW